MYLVKPVESSQVRRLRHPLLLVRVYLYYAGNELGSGLQNGSLKRFIADVLDKQVRYQKLCLRELLCLVYKVDVQALQNSRKLSISLRYRAEVVRIDVHTVDRAELVGVDVFKSVSACNSQNCRSLYRVGGELLLHNGIESLKLPHRIKAHVLFVVVKTYFFPWVAHIQHLSKSYSSFIRK